MSHDQLGFFIYRGIDNGKNSDFFCGWQWSEDGRMFKNTWVSQRKNPNHSSPSIVLYRTESEACEAAKELMRSGREIRVEVMQVLGGYVKFGLTESVGGPT